MFTHEDALVPAQSAGDEAGDLAVVQAAQRGDQRDNKRHPAAVILD